MGNPQMKPLRHEGPTSFSVFLRPRVVFGEETNKTPKNFRFLQRNKIKNPLRPFSYHMAWNTGGREDILRRRPPDFCKLVVWILILTIVVQYVNGISCNLDEVQKYDSSTGGYHCIKCPVCPPGQGLDRQCLNFEKLNENESLKCKMCKTGTFSDKNDTASCQACQQCDGLKTLKYCTKTENTQCSKECKDGFKLEKVFGNLQTCVPYTKKPMTTLKPKIHLYTTGERPTPSNVDSVEKRPAKSRTKSTQKSTIDINNDEETKTPSVNNQGQEGEKQKPIVVTIISISLLICFTFIFVYGVKKRKKIWRFICHLYCSCKRGSDQNLNETAQMNPDEQQELEEIVSVPMNLQGEGLDPVSATSLHPQGENTGKSEPVYYPVTHNLACQYLKDVSYNLKGKIASKISKRGLKGWREIGEMCNISKTELDEMETRSLWSCGNTIPGELLLEFLGSSKPQLSLKEFIEMLGSLERDDIIRLIHQECHITE